MASSAISDQSLELLLAETRWGTGGVAARITGSPDPAKMRAFWAGLSVYRLTGQHFQNCFDQALAAVTGKNRWSIYVQSVIQAKHDMMQAPGDYPFCLSPVEWREHCQKLWGGMIDSTDFRPPNAVADTLAIIAKTLFGVGAGIYVATLIPEGMLAGTAIAAIGGPAMARGALVAGANTVVEHLLPSNNPLNDLATAAVWRRYQLESRRRKLA